MLRFHSLMMFLLCTFCFSQTSQLGVGTPSPTETLDVNGTVRIRKIDNIGTDPYMVLVKNEEGVIKELDKSTFIISSERKAMKIKSKQSIVVTNDQGFESANIIVLVKNACSRYMITSFQSFNGALVFLNGVGRDIAANAVLKSIAASEQAYSATWTITFPKILGCSGYSSNDYFNFSLLKKSSNTYTLTNDSGDDMEYIVVFQKI